VSGGGPVVARPRVLEFRRGQGGAGQRVARVASRGPRERTEVVGWLRDRAGS
jgi:hypothetical protein